MNLHVNRFGMIGLSVSALVTSLIGPATAQSKVNLVPVGHYHHIGKDWRVKTLGSDLNANQEIANENSFNDPPGRGHQYVIVSVRGQKITRGQGDLYFDLDFKLLGPKTKHLYGDCGQVIPRDLGFQDSVLKGGRVTGNVCFNVKKSDITRGLRLHMHDFSSGPSAWYKIRPGSARY